MAQNVQVSGPLRYKNSRKRGVLPTSVGRGKIPDERRVPKNPLLGCSPRTQMKGKKIFVSPPKKDRANFRQPSATGRETDYQKSVEKKGMTYIREGNTTSPWEEKASLPRLEKEKIER